MKDIEQLFKEKLQQQAVSPPGDTWDKLEDAWQQKEHKKKGSWLWLAASIALLLTLGTVFYMHYDQIQSNAPVAVELPDSSKSGEQVAIDIPKAADGDTSEELTVRDTDSGLDQEVEVTKKIEKPTISEELSPEMAQRSSTPNEVEIPEPLAHIETMQLADAFSAEPSIIERPKPGLLADASTDVKPKMTIIYKSGSSSASDEEEAETRNPLEKAVGFLNNIKENGVGFSELRSAKSELLSKAFSNKREAMPAQ